MRFTQNEASRLDAAVASELKISRNQALNLIKSGLVAVSEKTADKPSFALKGGEQICVNFKTAEPKANEYEVNFKIPIIYEDDDLLVLNKPPQVITHGAPSVKEATLVEWLNLRGYMLSNLNGEIRAGIVHRLDKGTSGAIVVAKNNATHAALSQQLSDKTMGRIYLALTDLPLKESCIVERPIARSPANRLKNAIVVNGRYAKSAFVNLLTEDETGGLNLIAAKLFTGRTHQIRVHLASLNRHILGDDLYGFKSQKGKISRVMLHAYLLYFTHPHTGERVEFSAPLWSDFNEILSQKISKEMIDEKINQTRIARTFERTDSWLRLQ